MKKWKKYFLFDILNNLYIRAFFLNLLIAIKKLFLTSNKKTFRGGNLKYLLNLLETSESQTDNERNKFLFRSISRFHFTAAKLFSRPNEQPRYVRRCEPVWFWPNFEPKLNGSGQPKPKFDFAN